jgi:hypothetical protein
MTNSFLDMTIIRMLNMESKISKIALSLATILSMAAALSHALSGKIFFLF